MRVDTLGGIPVVFSSALPFGVAILTTGDGRDAIAIGRSETPIYDQLVAQRRARAEETA